MTSAGPMVMIARPGWRDPVYVPVSNPSASWEVSGIGRFSGHVPAARAHALGFGDLKGLWLRYDHPTMGVWGGQIRRNPTDALLGTMELSADSFAVRLKGVLTPISLDTASGSPGQIVLRLITISATDKRMWFDSIAASSDGPALRIELRGDDLYDVIDSIARDTDHEFDVTVNDDGTIDWEFRRRVGSNLTGSIILAEGLNIVGGPIAPTIDPLVNHILAVPDNQDWIAAGKKVVTDPDSIETYERQAVTRRYTGMPGISSLTTRANYDLAREANPAVPATVTVRDNHPVLRRIRQGDTVRLWSARQNNQYFFRIISRSVEGGLAKLAGDCVDEGDVE